MSINNFQSLIQTIKSIKLNGKFEKYIDFIQFPYYHNFEPKTKISFDFPLTVLIGQNGCGKSSCLHALYGAPAGNTPSRFWFETKVDPILYFDNEKRRHSFWYSFSNEKGATKEVVKTRIRRTNDPDYWETSRPLAWAGMRKRNDNKRDKPILKNVVYIDFRSELSAFDKFFYFGSIKNSAARNKQEFIRRKSASLNNLFTKKKNYINSSTRKLNDPLEELSSNELYWISNILNRNYTGGLSVLHELFREEGYSVLFNTEFARYSEAFAGSGEMAVVRLVKEVLAAEEYSLILLDEPEVSLHPGAQHRLKIFLLEQIKRKKHQIVITSHSPSIVSNLPREAVKVFFQKPGDGRFIVKENLTPGEAFFHIEFPMNSKHTLIVEDILAKQIVDGVLNVMGDETKNLFNVEYNPGGVSVIKNEFITVYCRKSNSEEFILFDGDQKPEQEVPNWQEFSSSDLNVEFLQARIKEITGEDIKFSVDGGRGGSNGEQKVELLKKYLDYYGTNVYFLPKQIPEEIIWKKKFAKSLIAAYVPEQSGAVEKINQLDAMDLTKEKFAHISQLVFGESDSEHISNVHKMFLQNWLGKEGANFQIIKNIINEIIDKTQ
jgi:predicted ATPase